MEIGQAADERREAQLANAVVTGAAKGRGGVIDMMDTLNAIHEGRVQTLLIREGFRAQGSRCKQCGYVASPPLEACPFCGGESEKIPDAVELAVRKVMQSGGDVEVLQQNQAVKGFDKIGAVLRY